MNPFDVVFLDKNRGLKSPDVLADTFIIIPENKEKSLLRNQLKDWLGENKVHSVFLPRVITLFAVALDISGISAKNLVKQEDFSLILENFRDPSIPKKFSGREFRSYKSHLFNFMNLTALLDGEYRTFRENLFNDCFQDLVKVGFTEKVYAAIKKTIKAKGYFFRGEIFREALKNSDRFKKKNQDTKYFFYSEGNYSLTEKKLLNALGAYHILQGPQNHKLTRKDLRDILSAMFENEYSGDNYMARELGVLKFAKAGLKYDQYVQSKHAIYSLARENTKLKLNEIAVLCGNTTLRNQAASYFNALKIPFYSNYFFSGDTVSTIILRVVKAALENDLEQVVSLYNQHFLKLSNNGKEINSNTLVRWDREYIKLDFGVFKDKYDLSFLSKIIRSDRESKAPNKKPDKDLIEFGMDEEDLIRLQDYILIADEILRSRNSKFSFSEITRWLSDFANRLLKLGDFSLEDYTNFNNFAPLVEKVFGKSLLPEDGCDYFLEILPRGVNRRMGTDLAGFHLLTLDDFVFNKYKHLIILDTEESIFLKNMERNKLISEKGNEQFETALYGQARKTVYSERFRRLIHDHLESLLFILPDYGEESIISRYIENIFRIYPRINRDIYIIGEKEKIANANFTFSSSVLLRGAVTGSGYPALEWRNRDIYQPVKKNDSKSFEIVWQSMFGTNQKEITAYLSSPSRIENFMKCPAFFAYDKGSKINNISTTESFSAGNIFHDVMEEFINYYKGKDLLGTEADYANYFKPFIARQDKLSETRLNDFALYLLDLKVLTSVEQAEGYEFFKKRIVESKALEIYDLFMASEIKRDSNSGRILLNRKIAIIKFLLRFCQFLGLTDSNVTKTFCTEVNFNGFKINTPGGNSLSIGGKIDFLYIDQNGEARVIDFKSANINDYEDDINVFNNVQLLIYTRVLKEALRKGDYAIFISEIKNKQKRVTLGDSFWARLKENPNPEFSSYYLSNQSPFLVQLDAGTAWHPEEGSFNFLSELDERIGEGKVFYPRKNPGCNYCRFSSFCPESTESTTNIENYLQRGFEFSTPSLDIKNFDLKLNPEETQAGAKAGNKYLIKFKGDISRALEEQKKNIVISAGAGAGKTEVLSSRFVRLLLENPSTTLDNIICITFTNKAVGEMKKRIYSKISDAIESGITPALVEGRKDLRLSRAQLEKLKMTRANFFDRSKVMTFHSFCLDNINEYGKFSRNFDSHDLSNKIVEDFTLQEEKDKYLREQARQEFTGLLEKSLISREEWEIFIQWLRKENIYSEANGKTFGIVHDILGLVEMINLSGRFFSSWDLSREGFLERYKSFIEEEKNNFLNSLEELKLFVAENAPPEKTKGLLAMINSYDIAGFSRKRFEDEDFQKSLREKAKAIRSQNLYYIYIIKNSKYENPLKLGFDEIVDSLQIEKEYTIRKVLFLIARAAANYMEEYKRKNGFVEQSDLHLRFLNLLEDENEGRSIRNILKTRYKFILVDEFQDTNWLQDRILKNLHDVGNNFLFIVGDLKQSIYRFQQCDNQIFSRYMNRSKTEKDFEYYSLRKNYRSEPAIVHFNNYLFSKNLLPNYNIFPITSLDPQKPEFATTREADKNSPCSIIFNEIFYNKSEIDSMFGSVFSEKELNELVKIKEAEFIAEAILANDPGKKNLNSFGVLIRSYTRVNYLLETLKKYNIPFSFIMKGGLMELPEVNIFLGLLRILFGLSHSADLPVIDRKDLFNLKNRMLEESLLERGVVLNAYYVFHSDEFQTYLKGLNNYTEASRNIQVLIEELARIENQYKNNPCGVLNHLEKAGKSLSLETFYDNSIKIMTIHSAKGLEFDTLFLVNISDRDSTEKGVINFIHQIENEGSTLIDFTIKSEKDEAGQKFFEYYLSKEYKRRNDLFDERENANLLYVALTRAKKNIFVSMLRNKIDKGKPKLNKNFLHNLDNNLFQGNEWKSDNDSEEFIFEEGGFRGKVKLNRIDVRSIDFKTFSRSESRGVLIQVEKETKKAWQGHRGNDIISVSEIIMAEADKSLDLDYKSKNNLKRYIPREDEPLLDEELYKIEGPGYREIGNFIHSFMEINLGPILGGNFDFEKEFDEFKTRFPYKTKSFYEDVRVMVKNALGAGRFFDLAKDYSRLYFEQPVLFHPGKGAQEYIYGIIDLIIETIDSVYIIDYKTHTDDSLYYDWLLEKHKNQLNLYEEAMKGIYQDKDIKKYLFVIGKKEAQLIRVTY